MWHCWTDWGFRKSLVLVFIDFIVKQCLFATCHFPRVFSLIEYMYNITSLAYTCKNFSNFLYLKGC